MDKKRIVRVAFPLNVQNLFDYSLAPETSVQRGSRVLVDFNRKKKVGVAVSFAQKSAFKKINPVIDVLDAHPSLSLEHLYFAKRLSQYYLYSWGEMIFMMMPEYMREKKSRVPLASFAVPNPSLAASHEVQFVRRDTMRERFEFYLERVSQALGDGSVLLCFPLISHIAEFQDYCPQKLREKMIIMHSQQSPRQNYENWLLSREGKHLIVGTRFALFCYPLDLRLVIVEEENSPYYFQPEKPYYHLADVAWLLCHFKKIPLILSGAYPSLTTYKRWQEKKVDFDGTPEIKRVIQVFDLRDFHVRRSAVFTPFILELMRKNLEGGKRILIVWSKANFSSILRCNNCGHVLVCRRCSGFLKFSLSHNTGVCSWCGYEEKTDKPCAACNSGYVQPVGIGIDRLEKIVKSFFPEMRVDQLSGAGLKTQILLSTSRVANRPRQLPSIDACFALDVDNLLCRVDYDATFDVFTYIKDLSRISNALYIFTHVPDHYLWRNISDDFSNFYDQELCVRKKLLFPPYGSLAKITIRGKEKNLLLKKANSLYNKIGERTKDVFGPVEEIPFRLRDNYRYSIIVKNTSRSRLLAGINPIITQYRRMSGKIALVIQ